MGQQSTQPGEGPSIVGSPNSVQVINGVAPKLSLCAEIIRRHARDHLWPALLVQKKQFRVGPHIAGVGRNEKGQVADQTYAFGAGVCPEPFALPEKQELREADFADLIRQLDSNPVERRRFPLYNLRRPFKVICVVELGFKRPEQRVLLEPVRLVNAEFLIDRPQGPGEHRY